MAAAATDKLRKVARRWVGQIGSGGVADDTVTTIPLSSSTNLPTGTAVSVVIDRVDANGTETPTLEETSIGIVSSTNLVSCVRGEEGTAQAHDAGAVVEVLLTSNMWNDMVDWGVVEHSQLGVHTTAAVTTLKASGVEINTGTEDGKIVTPKAIEDSKVLMSDKTWDAWIEAGAMTYASATTITVASGAAAKFAVGDKIKLTQTTAKYFYVVSIADTVLTVTGGSDYTVANAAITLPYYSHASSPIGFPSKFAYTATVTSGTGTITTASAVSNFKLIGRTVFLRSKITITTNGTGATDVRITYPITPAGAQNESGYGRSLSTGHSLNGVTTDTSRMGFATYANNYPGATGHVLLVSAYYEI